MSSLTLIASASTSPSSPVPPSTTSGWSLIRVRHHISSITTRHHSLISWIAFLALVALIVVRLVGLLVEHLLWHLHLMLLKLLWVHIMRLLIIHSSHMFLSRVEPFLVIMLLLLRMSVISAHSSSSWCFDSWSVTKENDSNIKILGSESFTKWLVWDACARDFYRPQRSWAKVMFLQACVCPRGGGVSASVHAGIPTPPPWADAPPPPGADPPQSRHPPGPGSPPPEADCSIRLTSGRYASYWNAFLFVVFLPASKVWVSPLPLLVHTTQAAFIFEQKDIF